jgi:hypothetical protein
MNSQGLWIIYRRNNSKLGHKSSLIQKLFKRVRISFLMGSAVVVIALVRATMVTRSVVVVARARVSVSVSAAIAATATTSGARSELSTTRSARVSRSVVACGGVELMELYGHRLLTFFEHVGKTL